VGIRRLLNEGVWTVDRVWYNRPSNRFSVRETTVRIVVFENIAVSDRCILRFHVAKKRFDGRILDREVVPEAWRKACGRLDVWRVYIW
jgi:hypothetical protein